MEEKELPSRLTVRDILAINRTVLANERTFLAYLRTSATFLIAGISLLKLFESILAQMSGVTLIVCSVVVVIYGIIKYDAMKMLIFGEKNVHHARDISTDYDHMYVPRLMWEMVHKAYSKISF